MLKIEGKEATPYKPGTSYRLIIIPSGDEQFILKAECLYDIGALNSSAAYLFRFFPISNQGLNPSLRASKRKALLYKAFFDLGNYELGGATYVAKLNVYALSSVWGDLVNTYILFGDPATTLGVVP